MPNTSVSGKKLMKTTQKPNHERTNKQNNNSAPDINSSSGSNNNDSCIGTRTRKRKRCELVRLSESDIDSELEDCNVEDAMAIEKKLRTVAEKNSLSDQEMRKLLQTFVKNEHILALVTLQAEDEVAKEKQEQEKKMSVIITDTPNVLKLTRSKAKELKPSPTIIGPAISTAFNAPKSDIASLINETLHSDEEDDEYTFKEEDFHSDDDPSTIASDVESNPRTPLTPMNATDNEISPVKYTEDGCFKIPLNKKETTDDLQIYARTRSKLSLQQTNIEDIEADFVPPDVEQIELQELDYTATDDDWMQFLNEFSRPLQSAVVTDEDDPINDPEYVAAEREPVDAEELRDVNISRKELTDLVASLFEGLIHENVSIENIELETPQKFLENNLEINNFTTEDTLNTPPENASYANGVYSENCHIHTETPALASTVSRQINFDETPPNAIDSQHTTQIQENNQMHPNENVLIEANNVMTMYPQPVPLVHQPYTEEIPNMVIVETVQVGQVDPAFGHVVNNNYLTNLNNQPELIAVPLPGQPNCYQIAKIVKTNSYEEHSSTKFEEKQKFYAKLNDSRYTTPYDANHTSEYISIKRHINEVHRLEFENLRYLPPRQDLADSWGQESGLTPFQHEILQQQLRIHVQMLTQSYLQTYSHPDFWKLASKPKEMLLELQERSKANSSFHIWNLGAAIDLTKKWEDELSVDSEANSEMMNFIHREIERTNRNTRQIPRFAPRLMDFMLDSNVFMYPDYLPRIPFSPKVLPYHVFAPSESYLIAMGLDKYYKYSENKSGRKLAGRYDPYDIALRRLSKDTVHGKSKRRILWQIDRLKVEEGYNPIKYYFDNHCAPPIYQTLITFENNSVPKLIDRQDELPPGWRKYINERDSGKDVYNPDPRRKPGEIVVKSEIVQSSRAAPRCVSENAKTSYLEFVKEAVGETISIPENLLTLETEATRLPKDKKPKNKTTTSSPSSVIINVNYVFGSNLPPSTSTSSIVPSITSSTTVTNASQTDINNSNQNLERIATEYYNNTGSNAQTTTEETTNNKILDLPKSPEHSFQDKAWSQLPGSTPIITKKKTPTFIIPNYEFDLVSNTLIPVEPSIVIPETRQINSSFDSPKQKKLTDYYSVEDKSPCKATSANQNQGVLNKTIQRKRFILCKPRKLFNFQTCLNIRKSRRKFGLKHRQRQQLKKRCRELLQLYRLNLEKLSKKYEHTPLIQYIYNKVKALELYTQLLNDLKMFCRTTNPAAASSSSASSSPASTSKRTRTEQSQDTDGSSGNNITKNKKTNRQEESFRQMLMPESFEETNRKDAIFAYNFYEKVEATLTASKKPEACRKFNTILKSFDPTKDKVSDLYYKIENLFLPDHPELVQVFLSFLLPSEASEIGKFFEHFMITNATTFINKLNIYFSKQPAQIRKIYNCLNELAEDPATDMKQVEAKVIPLLKGNQFLKDWFLQQFPEAVPPERILPAPETINMKEASNFQKNGEYVEHVVDVVEPSSVQDQQACQLRYINGRIFYGSKILLPAKLSFMAAKINDCLADNNDPPSSGDDNIVSSCIHGIREQGEKLLLNATAEPATVQVIESPSEDNDRSEEEDSTKGLQIDTTADDQNSNSSIEPCDEATLRAHALRLNPSFYNSSMFSNSVYSNANAHGHLQSTHGQTRKSSLTFNEDCLGKISPRKQSADIRNLSTAAAFNQNMAGTSSASEMQTKDKRRSPMKKIRSPVVAAKARSAPLQPMVVIHEPTPTLNAARKLKALINSPGNETGPDFEEQKANLQIVARSKKHLNQSTAASSTPTSNDADSSHIMAGNESQDCLLPKEENSDDLEFLPESNENTELNLPAMPYYMPDAVTSKENSCSSIISHSHSNSHSSTSSSPMLHQTPNRSSQLDSDEDCKLDIVAHLVEDAQEEKPTSSGVFQEPKAFPTPIRISQPWTRDEDKVILIEMKLGSNTRNELFERIQAKLRNRSLNEINDRHQFLIDFLAKLQGR